MGRLDLSSDPNPRRRVVTPSEGQPPTDSPPQRRKFLGIKFLCCGIYDRVYVNRDGTAYEGRCPRCMKSVKLMIGEGGTDQRFFEVY